MVAYSKLEARLILDVSDGATGAVLSQKIGEQEHVIAYGSRCLSKAKHLYFVTRKELLGIVHFGKYFCHYLHGKDFLL